MSCQLAACSLSGLVLLMVGKMEKMEGEDFYNDDWNINDLKGKEEKHAVSIYNEKQPFYLDCL